MLPFMNACSVILTLSAVPGRALGFSGQIKTFAGYLNASKCVQDSFTGCFAGFCLLEAVHCTDMNCVCDDIEEAVLDVASIAASSCKNTEAAANATTILYDYCAQDTEIYTTTSGRGLLICVNLVSCVLLLYHHTDILNFE
jgi:hypothetical protein